MTLPPDVPPAPTSRVGTRMLLGALGLVAVGVIGILGIVAIANGAVRLTADPVSSGRPLPIESLAPVAVEPEGETLPGESPEPTPSASAEALPGDCTQIYSAAYLERLRESGYPLNDPARVGTAVGTRDAQLRTILATLPTLECHWGAGGDAGLSTNVSLVTPAQAQSVRARLSAAGYTCYAENSGQRCLSTSTTGAGEEARGESHFVREDLWIATDWVGFTPPNYTGEIVERLFPR